MKVLLLVVELLAVVVSVRSLSPDGWALLDFRSNIQDESNHTLWNWSAHDENPCNWFGVSCEAGKVTSINLGGLSLKGTLSPEVSKLVDLRELLLRGNKLSGSIPFQLGELGKLEVLDLAYNQFSGQLPEDLGNLFSLRRLYLANNLFEGEIPAKLGELENLCELMVNVNKFTGIIPGVSSSSSVNSVFGHSSISHSGVCKLKYLQIVDFSSNYFEGHVPSCLRHLPSAKFFFNCLYEEHFLHQRPIHECTRQPHSTARRRLLQVDGSVINGTINNNTEGVPLNMSTGSPAPSPADVQASIFQDSPAAVPAVPNEPSPPPSGSLTLPSVSSNSDTRKPLVIGGVVAGIVLIGFVIAIVTLHLRYRRKCSAVGPWKGSMSGELLKEITKGVPAFSRAELEAACEDFSNIIGCSPDIVLFKGTLANSDHVEIAVTSIRKSAKSWSVNSESIFCKKVESLSRMKHENLVKILGYCAEEDPFIRMLVFEYVPNGTVHEHLHNPDSEHLDWAARMKIIMGVANALDYMHSAFDSPISHTKLDSNSVFLTEDFSPKVADFGLWKASKSQRANGQSHEQGREDLELSDRLVPLLESNVYDFGVFVLEVITGRLPYTKELGSLPEWALSYIGPAGKGIWIVDPTLQYFNSDELKVITRIAYDCLQYDMSSALTMTEISSKLRTCLSSDKEHTSAKSGPLLWAELQILSQD